MNKRKILLAAAAPMAVMSGQLVPDAVIAAETTTARPIPKIRTFAPVKIENTPRILTRVPVPEEEKAETEEERVRVDSAEQAPTPRKRTRDLVPRIDTPTPVDVEDAPRIRSRVAEPVDEAAPGKETIPRIRTRTGTPRADTSAPAEVEKIPYIRTRLPTPFEEVADEPATPRVRTRTPAADADDSVSVESADDEPRRGGGTPRIDIAIPDEIMDLPRLRKRAPSSEADETDANATPSRRRTPRSRVDDDLPTTAEEWTPRKRVQPDRIDTAMPVDVENLPRQRYDMADSENDAPLSVQTLSAKKKKICEDRPVSIRADNGDGPPTLVVPPSDLAAMQAANSIALKAGGYSEFANKSGVIKTIPAAALRANPTITLGKTKANFTSMLNNPKALMNIATKLRAMPDLVEVRAESLEGLEIKQTGLAVRSLLTYQFKLGACNTPQRRAKIEATGISCFVEEDETQITQSFSSPRDARYIADPRLRAKAIAKAKQGAAAIRQQIDSGINTFRNSAASAGGRAELVAQIGECELERLEALTDTELAGELANANETRIEQVAFVPSSDGAQPAPPPPAKPSQPKDVDAEYELAKNIFVSGFTLKKGTEWRQRVQTTIKWCLVGCKETYFVEVFAGVDFGFGLRVPIAVDGTYRFKQSGGVASANLTPRMIAINGSVGDFAAAGMPADLIYSGKELVAQITAYAGASAKLPFVGTLGDSYDLTLDLTEFLPGDFKNGQFTPPSPGYPKSATKIFDDWDLIGGRANFGVLGAKILPQVKITLRSTKLQLDLLDHGRSAGTGDDVKLPVSNGTLANLIVGDQNISHFTLKDPQYAMNFSLTPGLVARLFVDLSVWRKNWDLPVWFPDLEVKLAEVDLSCHAGTVCSRDYFYGPSGQKSAFEVALDKWSNDFDALWTKQCLDEMCKLGVGWSRQYGVLESWKKLQADGLDPNSPNSIKQMMPIFVQATKYAKMNINDSLGREAAGKSKAMSALAEGLYLPRCADIECYNNVKALAQAMEPRAKQLAKDNPNRNSTWISQQVNKEFAPQFEQEIADSKLRVAVDQARKADAQLKKNKLPKLPKN